jgi:hypothetical protein
MRVLSLTQAVLTTGTPQVFEHQGQSMEGALASATRHVENNVKGKKMKSNQLPESRYGKNIVLLMIFER